VALVGSSVVDVSIDPGELGAPGFNAALGAGSMGMVADFTRAVVVPRLDPRIVVVGVTSRELNDNALDQAGVERRFRDAPAVREALGTESLLDRVERLAGDVSALVEYRSVLRDPDNWLGDPPTPWGPELTAPDGLYLGFLDAAYRLDEATRGRLGGAALRDFSVGGAKLRALRSLIGDLTAAGRHVLLVATPVSDDFVALHPRGTDDDQDFRDALRTVADAEGVPLVDAGVWDRSLFADPLHVNRAGMERFTAQVRSALTAQGWI
jgi:hypothetical protein